MLRRRPEAMKNAVTGRGRIKQQDWKTKGPALSFSQPCWSTVFRSCIFDASAAPYIMDGWRHSASSYHRVSE